MLLSLRFAANLGVLLVCALLPAAEAQPAPPPSVGRGAGGMATRSVSRYLGLERGLQQAIEQRDRASVTTLLADDFELRSASGPDIATADDWLRREFAAKPNEGLVRDLSVREVDDLAIVSFLIDRGPVGRPATTSWFVIDVWRQSSQRLLARSITRATGASPKTNRPTGRE
jgi:hypothetical protein